MAWKTVRLELARAPDYPAGSAAHGYELHAPLSADGHLDADLFRSAREKATVRRFWRGEPDKEGDLIHTRNGWAFSYEPGDADDEPLFRLDRHLLKEGEYITVTEPDGAAHTLRVVSVA